MFTKWIRIIHRWLAIPLMVALIISIGWSITQGASTPPPGWVGALGISSIFSLFISGSYLFFRHYWAKWQRGQGNRQARGAAEVHHDPLSL